MKDYFITDSLILYIEREIVVKFITKSITGDFWNFKKKNVEFQFNRL